MKYFIVIAWCVSFLSCNINNGNPELSAREQDSIYKNFVDSVWWVINRNIPDKEKHVVVKDGATEYHFKKYFGDSKGNLAKYFSYNVKEEFTTHEEFYYLDDKLILVRLMNISGGNIIYKSGYYFRNNNQVWNYIAGVDPNSPDALVLKGMLYLNNYKKDSIKRVL